jgi:transketolase
MGIRVVHVMTHDSIGLGEDGPTHQPVEHLAALRAIPNLNVFRPCDAMEVAECWELALRERDRPSVIALTRQNLPALRTEYSDTNFSARGAYVLHEAGGRPDVTIFATGSEVEIAIAAAGLIARERYGVRVVSVPCFELFESQSEEYKKEILDTAPVKVAIEAAVRMGWDRFIGNDGIFVGMEGFGASAPYEKLYEHFGITARRAADLTLARLRANA